LRAAFDALIAGKTRKMPMNIGGFRFPSSAAVWMGSALVLCQCQPLFPKPVGFLSSFHRLGIQYRPRRLVGNVGLCFGPRFGNNRIYLGKQSLHDDPLFRFGVLM
jgi:hypothetical protein